MATVSAVSGRRDQIPESRSAVDQLALANLFGGYKQSGFGEEETFACTQVKNVNVKFAH
jgi:hypothetical protein